MVGITYLAIKKNNTISACEMGTWFGVELAIMLNKMTVRQKKKFLNKTLNTWNNDDKKVKKIIFKSMLDYKKTQADCCYLITKNEIIEVRSNRILYKENKIEQGSNLPIDKDSII